MKLRGAVVGVGYLGNFHAQKYRDLTKGAFSDKISFVGVCDVHAPQAQKVAEAVGVEAFTRPEDLIGKVDLVTIATVTSHHFQMAKMFLENGIHVNVEKPMTVTVNEAEALVGLAKKKGLTLCVGHSERFNPLIREIRQRGPKIKTLELHRHAPFKARGADVSVIHDLMIHDLDLAMALVGTKPKVTQSNAGKVLTQAWDWARCELDFGGGVTGLISVSRLAPSMTRQVKVMATDHYLEGNLQTGELTIGSTQGGTTENPFMTTTQACGKGDNLLLETEAYFHAVLGDAQPAVSGTDGLQAMQLLDEVLQKI